ncbi:MAG: GGDEF domain-containing protein [Gallionella sp.]|nr:GGDEF domain-containing protein [Gallionella sp.]
MTSTPETLNVLRSAPLFRGIPDHLLAGYLSKSELKFITSGRILLTPGQSNDTIYMILSGRLRIQTKEFEAEPIAILGAGECVGEMSMLGGAPVSAYVIAATDCKLLALGHGVMWELINNSHAAAHNMLNILTSRIRNTNQIAAENLERQQGFSAGGLVDELTGLYNRHWMLDKFERHLHRGIVGKKPSCLLLLEIDRLREFNDRYGQLGGDQALRNTAHLILSCLRPHDEAGQNSRESFAIFMPDTSLPDAHTAADRLMASISQSLVVLPSGDALPAVTISIGLSQTRSDDTLKNLLTRAGEALQLARDSGGNCVESLP